MVNQKIVSSGRVYFITLPSIAVTLEPAELALYTYYSLVTDIKEVWDEPIESVAKKLKMGTDDIQETLKALTRKRYITVIYSQDTVLVSLNDVWDENKKFVSTFDGGYHVG